MIVGINLLNNKIQTLKIDEPQYKIESEALQVKHGENLLFTI
jgi:hypothetical protein